MGEVGGLQVWLMLGSCVDVMGWLRRVKSRPQWREIRGLRAAVLEGLAGRHYRDLARKPIQRSKSPVTLSWSVVTSRV